MQRIQSFVSKTAAGVGTSLTMASVAVAADDPKVPNPVGRQDLGGILFDVVNALLLFAGAVAVLFLIIGGFRYVVSAGNAEQVEGAKKTIVYALLGLIVIFIAYVLVQLVQNYLGVTGNYNLNK